MVLEQTWKFWTSNLPNLDSSFKTKPWTPRTTQKRPNLEPRTRFVLSLTWICSAFQQKTHIILVEIQLHFAVYRTNILWTKTSIICFANLVRNRSIEIVAFSLKTRVCIKKYALVIRYTYLVKSSFISLHFFLIFYPLWLVNQLGESYKMYLAGLLIF